MNTLFQPCLRVTSMGLRPGKFSFFSITSLLFTLTPVLSHVGAAISVPLIQIFEPKWSHLPAGAAASCSERL